MLVDRDGGFAATDIAEHQLGLTRLRYDVSFRGDGGMLLGEID
jgi:hypothetical protein